MYDKLNMFKISMLVGKINEFHFSLSIKKNQIVNITWLGCVSRSWSVNEEKFKRKKGKKKYDKTHSYNQTFQLHVSLYHKNPPKSHNFFRAFISH